MGFLIDFTKICFSRKESFHLFMLISIAIITAIINFYISFVFCIKSVIYYLLAILFCLILTNIVDLIFVLIVFGFNLDATSFWKIFRISGFVLSPDLQQKGS